MIPTACGTSSHCLKVLHIEAQVVLAAWRTWWFCCSSAHQNAGIPFYEAFGNSSPPTPLLRLILSTTLNEITGAQFTSSEGTAVRPTGG